MGLLDDEKVLIDRHDKNLRKVVLDFLKANYYGKFKVSKEVNAEGKYEVSSVYNVRVTNKRMETLTNGLFVWSTVGGNFQCSECRSLKSLCGAPEFVGKYFLGHDCVSLNSLEGAPRHVEYGFFCSRCIGLTTLEGSPETVGFFDCSKCCNLESLEGAPKKINDSFDCSDCIKLTTLGDVPQRAERVFCSGCKSLTNEIEILIREGPSCEYSHYVKLLSERSKQL